MKQVKIVVPVTPIAKQSARFTAGKRKSSKKITGSKISASDFKAMNKTKDSIISYQDSTVKEYENVISLFAKKAMLGNDLLSGALNMHIVFVFEMTKSLGNGLQTRVKQGKKVYKITKPDVTDNLPKPVADSLNGIVYSDDSTVCRCLYEKIYGTSSRLEITVSEMDVFYKPK